MDDGLAHLISDFQKNVMAAVQLMYRSGIPLPSSCYNWIKMDIPVRGTLDGGGEYYKHGAGCAVSFEEGCIDFDFGEHGEIGEFNLWWLYQFAGNELATYGFDSETELAESLENALSTGALVCVGLDLCYLANKPSMFAIDIDSRLPGDVLPSRNQDPVFTLYAHTFQAADLMLENYRALSKKGDKNNYLSQREKVDHRIYLSTWLGFLRATCEGFGDLKMRLLLGEDRPATFKALIPMSDNLGRMMKKHADPLRELRNDVFHRREDASAVRQFFELGMDRLTWAHELHGALAAFFSRYRVLCEVHYLMNGRKGESDLRHQRLRRKKRAL
ncbi:DUF6896 domain-containing protein [Symbiopectobacterium purcellii]|uniref:DUF6896 domain-containing protein n=1 Tax=Symbiopectobacterium purcellii TaxID=2871826 RepID=A0ABX9AHM3_9ENTR|nr:hypothetical protein [Symbiopectobacterium purcellii]QZN94613.1 hypothetical protein K6K13_15115 [Symbiopectobacterium purcellii]